MPGLPAPAATGGGTLARVLGMAPLAVQSAQGVLHGLGLVVLHKNRVDAAIAVFLGVVGFQEVPARIAVHVGLDDNQAVDVRLYELHGCSAPAIVNHSAVMIPEAEGAGL